MLSRDLGRELKARRSELGIAQERLCREAKVSRAVLSRLESQRGEPVQTDVVDRLLGALGAKVTIRLEDAAGPSEERLRHRLRQAELRERHLRLALDLAGDPSLGRALVARARDRVDLWERNRTCSPDYVRRWRKTLSGAPGEVARAMASFGEWENAMFQNTPWSFAWT